MCPTGESLRNIHKPSARPITFEVRNLLHQAYLFSSGDLIFISLLGHERADKRVGNSGSLK